MIRKTAAAIRDTRARARIAALAAACAAALLAVGGCMSGPRALQETRLYYNEVIKATTEQQLLLNIVRLRYADTPSSLSVANVAAQFEVVRSLSLVPFFATSGAEPNRSYSTVLPGGTVSTADRPTVSYVPIDDQEFTRKLFTPLTLDGVIYLVKTTWPIGTVFRLFLENMNWVPNAEFASGPTPRTPPPYADFLRGILALEALQREGRMVIVSEDRDEPVGGPLPASAITAASMVEAAKAGFEWQPEAGGKTWRLVRKVKQPVLLLDPAALGTPEAREFVRTFRLKPGETRYVLTTEAVQPFDARGGAVGDLAVLDLETRSLLQALYFVSHGVEVPPEHAARRIARITVGADGRPFDWGPVTHDVFRVRWASGKAPPANAHVAVFYQDHWFYVDASDLDTKATLSLLMELSRLELQGKSAAPVFSLPLGR
jgi:hypothetical protein